MAYGPGITSGGSKSNVNVIIWTIFGIVFVLIAVYVIISAMGYNPIGLLTRGGEDVATGISDAASSEDFEKVSQGAALFDPTREAVIVHYFPSINGAPPFKHRVYASTYVKQRMVPHTSKDYNDYVTYEDEQIIYDVSFIRGNMLSGSYTQEDLANTILAYVHSIPYESDLDNYTKYPIETYAEGSGDCEDLSMLYASLLKAAGFDVAVIQLGDIHVGVGVVLNLPPSVDNPVYFEAGGKIYYYAETTGTEFPTIPATWEIGEMPSELMSLTAKIYPIK
ncbi:MAG: hypothetical protein JXA43_03215 [Candidatus Diapherotrites archaeon]|nr:hypothetical protein [Candidatus Diapherotrites archaeon]